MESNMETKMIYRLNINYYVRKLEEADINGDYIQWFEDQEVCRYNSHGKFFKTKIWFEEYIKSLNDESKIVWAICHNKDGHIGNISLQNLSFIDRTAELALIIGNKNHWGKKIGTISAEIIMSHGFNKLGLERIYCGTAKTNIGMQNLATRVGMKQEGIRRQHLFLEGRREDLIEFGILKEEFKSHSR